MTPVDTAAADTSLQPHEEAHSPDAEKHQSNEVNAPAVIQSGASASNDIKPARESKADVMRRMKSRSKSAIEHHSYHRERIVVDEDLYVRRYGFRESKLFVKELDQELESLSTVDEGAYAQLRNLSREDGAHELDKEQDPRVQRSNENERGGAVTPGHATSQNRASRSEPNLLTLEGMEGNDEDVKEGAAEISEKLPEQKQREGDGGSEGQEVGKAGEDSAQMYTEEDVGKANASPESDTKEITGKDEGTTEKERTGEPVRSDAKQSAKDDASASVDEAAPEIMRNGTNENASEDANAKTETSVEMESNNDVSGDAKRRDVKETISHAIGNTDGDAKPVAKENAGGEEQDDANKNAKEVQQNTNEIAKPDASESTNENAKSEAEHAEGLLDGLSEVAGNEQANLTPNQADAENNKPPTERTIQKAGGRDTRGDGTQNGETSTKYQASYISETEGEEGREEKEARKKSSHDTKAIIKKRTDERDTLTVEAARRTRVENSVHIELNQSRRREQVVSPSRNSHRANARASEAMSAIDHHSYYRERTVVDEAPYVPEYAGRDRQRLMRRRPSISELVTERRNDPQREREREEERERERVVRKRERDAEREWLDRQLGQDMENRRHERLEARESERQRIRQKEYHERERNKPRSRGADVLEVKQPSPAQARSPSATSRRPIKIISEPRREQEKVETFVRPRIITIPPQPDSASTTKLGVLGPKTYHYHPLKEMEFRLIKILPERMSILKTELLHQSLHDTLDYIAISYAWGDGVNTEELFLNGAKVPVAPSLYDALKAVRQKKSEVLVWVDALCIDQQNTDERASQVRLMGTIYSKATSTAVWLGPEADESELAMDLLQDVSDIQATPQRVKAIQQRIRATNRYPESAALFTLFKREYWRRLWVSIRCHITH